MTAILGIDLGTSQAKALLCAPDGTVLGQGAASYPVVTPRDGWAESDPELWWRAVRSAVREAKAGPAAAVGLGQSNAEVAAIGIAGQMHGVVLCNERTVALRPAILWLDRRASSEMKRYELLTAAQVASLGSAPWPGTAGPMLLWLSRHEPGTYRAARWQLQPKDWLRFRLTGEVATDPTDASATLLYDLPRDTWALDVVESLGLRPDLLAPVRGSGEVSGALLSGPAAELGLAAGIPVVTGCADTAASLLAAGLTHPLEAGSGWALLTLGTGGQWIAPVDALDPDPAGNAYLCRAVDGRYRLVGMQNVGVALDWVRHMLGASWDELYAAAAAARPAAAGTASAARSPAAGLRFEPWLVSERGRSGGGWTGATLAHVREDLLRAALAGVAGLLRDGLDDLRAAGAAPRQVLLGGGGSGHPAWRALLAEVLGVPLHPASTPSLTARGATLLAQSALSGLGPLYRAMS
ncbi:MAG TPA: FGGY family carbohydrate kinase [Streptosporangiaceae bacterium]